MNRTVSILAPRHRQLLAGVALSNVLVAFDYDGTLAPFATRPEDAHMRQRTRVLLAAVAQAYPTVVISGRALADITDMVKSVPLWYVYGNHGLEPIPVASSDAETKGWVDMLTAHLPRDLGVRIEDKGYSVTVHFRGVANPEEAVRAVEDVVRLLPDDVSVLRGSEALNLLPPGGSRKGAALIQAMEMFACHDAIYVGDEDTDEAAFATGDRTLSIRVEPSEHSRARFHLGSQRQIDRFLARLVDLRRGRIPRPVVFHR